MSSLEKSSHVVGEKNDFSATNSNDSLPASHERDAKEVIHNADTVLGKKIALVNDAIDEIGLTPYHWKLFCLNGFGYAADSVWMLLSEDETARCRAKVSDRNT